MIPVVTPYERVQIALAHRSPDRIPVDFLATCEIRDKLIAHIQPDPAAVGHSDYFDALRANDS